MTRLSQGPRKTITPLLKEKMSANNISNIYTKHIKGNLATGGGLFANTYHALSTCPYSFKAVRAILKNMEAVAPNCSGLIFAVTNSAQGFAQKVIPSPGNTVTNDNGVTGWSQATVNGATSWALPARVSANTGDYGIQITDWCEMHSIPAIDGCPGFYIMGRAKFDAAFTYQQPSAFNTDNTKQNYWETFSWAGDGVTTPANFVTPAANDTAGLIFGFEFLCDDDIIRFGGFGDSITQGLHTSAGSDSTDPTSYSWIPIIEQMFIDAGIPATIFNYGASGFTTAQYSRIFKNAVPIHKPAVALYSVYSPNDGALTQALINTMYKRALDAAQIARANGALPVFTFLAPNENLTASQDLLRVQLIANIKAAGLNVIDVTDILGDGASPARFRPAFRFDSVHPNRTGHQTIAPPIFRELVRILEENFAY